MSQPTSNSQNSSSSPSPIAIPKAHSRLKSILKHPMRDAASYLTALSQADADARAALRKNRSADSFSDTASVNSFMTSSAVSTSTAASSRTTSSVNLRGDNGLLLDSSSYPSSPSSDDNDDSDTSNDTNNRYNGLDVSPYSLEEQALHQFTTKHQEFGHCANESYRFTSAWKTGSPIGNREDEEASYYILLTTYFSYLILIVLGHIRDFLGKRFHAYAYKHLMPGNVRFFSSLLFPRFFPFPFLPFGQFFFVQLRATAPR